MVSRKHLTIVYRNPQSDVPYGAFDLLGPDWALWGDLVLDIGVSTGGTPETCD